MLEAVRAQQEQAARGELTERAEQSDCGGGRAHFRLVLNDGADCHDHYPHLAEMYLEGQTEKPPHALQVPLENVNYQKEEVTHPEVQLRCIRPRTGLYGS